MVLNKKNMLLGFASALAVTVFLQWLHFVLYFQQSPGISLVWSIVDWMVWFALFAGYLAMLRYQATNSLLGPMMSAAIFIVLAGMLQILYAAIIFQWVFGAERELSESFLRAMDKRWFQNILIAGVFVMVAHQLEQVLRKARSTAYQWLTVFDGKTHYKVPQSDVVAVCASRNYLSIYTAEKEIVMRSTLKSLAHQLNRELFEQISRSAFVNKQAVHALTKYSRSSYRVLLSNEQQFNVSRNYVANMQAVVTG